MAKDDDEIINIFADANKSMLHGAIAMHEMFISYVQAGFTEDQALKLLLGQLRGDSS